MGKHERVPIRQGSIDGERISVMENYRRGFYDGKWYDPHALSIKYPRDKQTREASRPVIHQEPDGLYVFYFKVFDTQRYVDGNRYYQNLRALAIEYEEITHTAKRRHMSRLPGSEANKRRENESNSDRSSHQKAIRLCPV